MEVEVEDIVDFGEVFFCRAIAIGLFGKILRGDLRKIRLAH